MKSPVTTDTAVAEIRPRAPDREIKAPLRALNRGRASGRSEPMVGRLVAPLLDTLWERHERALSMRARRPRWTTLLVGGLLETDALALAQAVVDRYSVGCVNNLAAMFPRSPIYANKTLSRWVRRSEDGVERDDGLGDVNDARFLWDRWLGTEGDGVPDHLEPGAGIALANFFAAYQLHGRRPVVSVMQRMAAAAGLVDRPLERAFFLLVVRDSIELAAAFYNARRAAGSLHEPVGMAPATRSDDPLEDICRQVVFQERMARRQRESLPGNMRLVSVESFTGDTGRLLERIGADVPEFSRRTHDSGNTPAIDRPEPLPEDVKARMQNILSDLGAGLRCDY